VEIDNHIHYIWSYSWQKNVDATLQVLDKDDSLFPDNYSRQFYLCLSLVKIKKSIITALWFFLIHSADIRNLYIDWPWIVSNDSKKHNGMAIIKDLRIPWVSGYYNLSRALFTQNKMQKWNFLYYMWPILMDARFKAWVCARSLDGIAGSKPVGVMVICPLWVFFVVRYRSLRRANHSSRGFLPNARCLNVIVKPR